jgi:hypothetical protein
VYDWGFSLVKAGCGSLVRNTRQRITDGDVCRGSDGSARARWPGGPVHVVLHGASVAGGKVGCSAVEASANHAFQIDLPAPSLMA